ncbi:hypothetical protein AX17_000297 [Amanita inopinata Kibby_2008]|nr:hypothetical protein AX17_000297 [Amanita inopinata Kibby_2008]
MTSSLRNSIHRPTHKERSQLSHRSKYGILEKHSDYVKRARDYHSKQDRLTRLRQKAAERNKDEFYFSMVKEKTKGGVHIKDRGNAALPTDIVKVLKTQDENYVRTMRMAGLKKIDSLKRRLMEMIDLVRPEALGEGDEETLDPQDLDVLREAGILPTAKKGKTRRKANHLVFMDNKRDATEYLNRRDRLSTKEPAAELCISTDLGWKAPNNQRGKIKSKKLDADDSGSIDDTEEQESAILHDRSRNHLVKELAARLLRDRQLRHAQREFEMQRLMMGKGARKKIGRVEKVGGGDDVDEEDEDEIDARKGRRSRPAGKVDMTNYKPRVYKWKLERKR